VIRLFREARALQETLDQSGFRFCFIGGIALQHWGEPRVTRDLDVAVFTGFGGEIEVVDTLLAAYAGRIADARDFALRHRVLLLTTPNSIDVDVAAAALPFVGDHPQSSRRLVPRELDEQNWDQQDEQPEEQGLDETVSIHGLPQRRGGFPLKTTTK
jgi:hypothetical protein